jgi:hypothetical protein
MSTLYYGDDLGVMRRHLKDEIIDLVYLDPPVMTTPNRVHKLWFSRIRAIETKRLHSYMRRP